MLFLFYFFNFCICHKDLGGFGYCEKLVFFKLDLKLHQIKDDSKIFKEIFKVFPTLRITYVQTEDQDTPTPGSGFPSLVLRVSKSALKDA